MTTLLDRPAAIPVPKIVPRPMPKPPVSIPILFTRIAFGIAFVAAWSVFFVTFLSSFPAARSQQVLYDTLRTNLAQEIAPIGGAIKPGTPVALISAPAINLRYVVVEGTSAEDLRAGPGHLRSTPLPGQAGVSVIFGRAVAFGGPFHQIDQLQAGDQVKVTTQQGTFTYHVDDVRHAGDPVPDPSPSGTGRMTMVSAEGVSWRAGWVPDRAIYVDTTMVGATVPTPAGRPTAVPVAEGAMKSDPGSMFLLVLWLQLLLVAGIGTAWAHSRWSGAQAWLAGAPVIFATLWGASDVALSLLPNLV